VWRRDINLLVDAFSIPGEDSVRLGNRSDLYQDLVAQLWATLGEGPALAIRELHGDH
jgi:hypothetical protein